MRIHYAIDPYETTARFSSMCPDCNKRIAKGDSITVWPSSAKGSKARHEKCSASDYAHFVAAAQDEYNMTRGGAY